MTIERMETTVATTSSAMLTGTLAVPPVVAVTAGRTAADFDDVDASRHQQAADDGDHRVDIGNGMGAGGKDDRSGCRADTRLDDIVDMVDGRDFISQHFNDEQDANHNEHPGICQQVVGRVQLDPICIMGDDADHQQRNIGVQPGTGR